MERSSIQDIAVEHIKKNKEVYKLTPERMFSEYNGEVENVKNYNNRQLLEMLQNADDAASEAYGEKKVLIKLIGETLIIANTGYPFSEDGLKSIFYSYLSPKELKENQIGKKGLGFRSILSWASKVTIKSHELCVSFCKEYGQRVLDELLTDPNFKKEFDRLNKGHKTPISILGCPNIEDASVIDFDGIGNYDTVIQIELFKKAKDDVIKQIKNDLDAEVLLFLNNLETIEIDNEGYKSSFRKRFITPNSIEIEHSHGEEKIIKYWNINTLSGRFHDIDKPYNLSIAWQDDLNENKDVIYAYLRTRVEIKCKGILHGSFELNADRNLIVDDGEGYNRRLALLLPELISQTAEIIAKKESNDVNYRPISFLQIDFKSINELLDIEDLGEELRLKIKFKRVFPTIDNRYIPWIEDDKPVYYEEEEFAEYLSPLKFPDLLLCCDSESDEEYINKFDPTTYKIEDIIDDVYSKKDDLPIETYARLISIIHDHIEDDTDLNGKELFYDNLKNGLSFSKPIFLPNEGSKYDLPKELGVQIINSDLANELLNKENPEKFSGLALRLNKYGIREYKFSELFEMIIEYYNSSIPTQQEIINQCRHLYNLFLRAENPGEKWLGKSPMLLSKDSKIKPADELYFGKEYGNSLTEELFHYDKSKIIASQKKFKIEDIDDSNWSRFLEWLGISYFPRKIILDSIPQEFIKYCLRNYNYKNSVGGYLFKNYTELVSYYPRYGHFKILSFDGLDEIISNNRFETLIQWLDTDKELLSSIIGDKQPTGCTIGILVGLDRIFRDIPSANLKSYVKWVFMSTKWIDTESGIKQSPYLCTNAPTVTAEFSPLIEKPVIDYEYFKKVGINRDRIEYFLSEVGVHKSINTFSTNVLYSIFLSLPDIDKDGQKSKTIYNQLAANYDDKLLDRLDKLDPNYIEYHKNGKVLCKSGLYIPLREVFYVNDKHYGETVIKQFNTIEIERRRGKDKIKKLFGVDPLDKVELSLEGGPQFHFLNNLFKAEMESFKPYVYVLRKEVDSGKEKSIIKDTRFELVTQLKLKLVKDGTAQIIELDDYEHFYLKTRNCVYLKIPMEHDNIQNLKDDIHICSSIAEAFSAILDVDAQRQQIRELFSKTGNVRDELLRAELDDQNLQKLADARSILGITTNLKLEFWKSFVKCFNKKKFTLKEDSDATLIEQLSSYFPQYIEVIKEVFNEINYEEINDENSSELIIKLFKSTDITIKKFNEFHYPPIDIKSLYEIDFKRSKDLNKKRFKSQYHEKCLKEDILKVKFIDVLNEYDFLTPTCENEIDYDVEKDLFTTIYIKYGINLYEPFSERNIDEIYKSNLMQIESRSREYFNETKLLDLFIQENPRVQSLIYFEDKIDLIIEQLVTWLGKEKPVNGKGVVETKFKRISFGNKVIFYNNLIDLKNQVEGIISEEVLGRIKIQNVKTSSIENGKLKDEKNGGSGSHIRKPKVPKEEIGFIGEYLVYRFLQETIEDKESIKWVSGYSQECGINPDGKDGLGYDFIYIPNGAKHPRYVEVKVIGNNDAFHISSLEVRFGEKYKKNHEVFLIRNIDNPTKLSIDRIQGLFDYRGKSFNSNDLFSVENDIYIIRFKRVGDRD